MLALRTSPPVFTEAQVERIARDTYGLLVTVRSLPGERDRNFRLHTADRREFVLKILDFNSSAEATECQLRVLDHLAEQDPSLPVPRVFPTVLGGEIGTVAGREGSYAVCLMGYLPGELLASGSADAPLLDNLGETLARLDQALRGFFHPALGQRIAWDVRRLPELVEHIAYVDSPGLRRSVENAAAAMRERLPALRSMPSQAIHGDCHAHNLLVDAAGRAVSGILDFGDMIHAPRILEPAVAMSELLAEERVSVEILAGLLAGYARRTPLEPAELELLYDLIVARHSATILVHAWRARHDAVGARVLEGSIPQTARSLARLEEAGRDLLTQRWARALLETAEPAYEPVPLTRRHRLLGAGAELFYERPLHIVRGSGVWLYDARGSPTSTSTTMCRTSGIPIRWSSPRSRNKPPCLRHTPAICTRASSSTQSASPRRCRRISMPACSSIPGARRTMSHGAWPNSRPNATAASSWSTRITASRTPSPRSPRARASRATRVS